MRREDDGSTPESSRTRRLSHAKVRGGRGAQGEGGAGLSHAKAANTPTPLPTGAYPRRLGPYVLVRPLGQGGMGVVELALSPRSQRPCVLKRMLPEARADRGEERFRREVKILSELEHSSIARALTVFELPETGPVLVQEFIYGRNLKQLCDLVASSGERLPVELSVGIILDACDALDVAFRTLGVVHRDLAPHNLMLSFAGGVKVIDFGVAKTDFDASLTLPGQLIGRRAYLAPEVLIGAPSSHASDLYSLGAIIWELLTGRSVATVAGSARSKWPPPSTINPKVPPALDHIVLRALAWRTSDRFQKASQFREALAPFADVASLPAKRRQFLRSRYDVDHDVRRLQGDLDRAKTWAQEGGIGRRGWGGGRQGRAPRPSRAGIVVMLAAAAAALVTAFLAVLATF
jgi:serine/threonine protein kinase